jgi:hypothetical protein
MKGLYHYQPCSGETALPMGAFHFGSAEEHGFIGLTDFLLA